MFRPGGSRVKILFLVLLVAAITLSAYFGTQRQAAEPDSA
jgi:hypothetical protein